MNPFPAKPVEVIIYLDVTACALPVCFESALRSFSGGDFIIVQETSEEARDDAGAGNGIRNFATLHGAILIENFDRLGYWKSVTKGIDRSCANYLVILNASAAVSRNGLRELVDRLHADASAEVALPLMDWQDTSLELIATAIDNSALADADIRERASFSGFPAFAMRRSASARLACWRYAENAAESLSEPLQMVLAPRCAACTPHPDGVNHQPWNAATAAQLAAASRDFQTAISLATASPNLFQKTVLFLLAEGDHAVPLEIQGLRDCGVQAQAATGSSGARWIAEHFPFATGFCMICDGNDADSELVQVSTQFDIVIATNFPTARILAKAREKAPRMIPLYYLQDYEPWSLRDEFDRREAERTLTDAALADVRFFARSQWLCQTMWHRHRIAVAKVARGLDAAFLNGFASKRAASLAARMIVCAIRPYSPGGNARNTLRMLRKVAIRYGGKVVTQVFGCTNEDLDQMEEARGFRFSNLSSLKRCELAQVLSTADIFADLSHRLDDGGRALEAMAAGCATILPREGCDVELERDGENCLTVDTSDEAAVLAVFDRLMIEPGLIARLRNQGLQTGRSHSMRKAVWSQMLWLSESAVRAES